MEDELADWWINEIKEKHIGKDLIKKNLGLRSQCNTNDEICKSCKGLFSDIENECHDYIVEGYTSLSHVLNM